MKFPMTVDSKEDLDLASILERATKKLQNEVTPIDTLTQKQAILEQRIRLTDEALKKLAQQQLRLGIDNVPSSDLRFLLESAGVEFDSNEPDHTLKEKVKNFLSSL